MAVDIADEENDIWTWDSARGQLMRLTFGPVSYYYPVWTRRRGAVSLSQLTSVAQGGTAYDIFRRPADNTGSVDRLTKQRHG